MKRMILTMAAVLTLGGAAMAQNEQNNDKQGKRPDKNEMIQRRTEMMASRYGLDDGQKAKLLELNKAYADKMGNPGMGRGGRGPGMRPNGPRPSDNGSEAKPEQDKKDKQQAKRPELTEEQKAKMKADFEEQKKNREAYEAEVKKILTEEQYKKYQEDESKRGPRGGQRGGGPRQQQ